VILRTYRLGVGTAILVSGDVDPCDPEGAALLAVLATLGVSVAIVPAGVELTLLSGPAYPIEIAPMAVVR
jgi:hypothetical protein